MEGLNTDIEYNPIMDVFFILKKKLKFTTIAMNIHIIVQLSMNVTHCLFNTDDNLS